MKEYPKKYEDVFTSERSLRNCDLSKIEIGEGGGTLKEYRELFRGFLTEAFSALWLMCVKIVWLYGKFSYAGKNVKKIFRNHVFLDRALSIFVRQYVGMDTKPLTRSYFFTKVASYFKDFYEDFFANNPFTNPELYSFPYKNISVDFLMVVYQMPERLELLEIADGRGFNFNQFMDYVINYISSYNEESNKQVYDLMMVTATPPYIRYNNRKYGKRRPKQIKT